MCGSTDNRFADENRTRLDGECLRLDVTDDFSTRLEFDVVGGGEVALDFSVDDDGRGFDLGLDASIFADGEIAIGCDFALDFAVDNQVIAELDRPFDFHVR